MMALDQNSQEDQNLRPETSKCISRQQVRNMNKTSQNFLSQKKRKQINAVLNEKNTKIQNQNNKSGTFASTSIGFYNESNNEYNPNVFQQGMSLEQYLGNGVNFKSIKLVENQKQNKNKHLNQNDKIELSSFNNANNKVEKLNKDYDNNKNNNNDDDEKLEQLQGNNEKNSLQQYMHLFSSCQSIPFQGNNKSQQQQGKYYNQNNSYDQENHGENDLFQKIEGFEINETDEDNFSESDTNKDYSFNNISNNNSTSNNNIRNEKIGNNNSRSLKNQYKYNINIENSSLLNVDKKIVKRGSQNSRRKLEENDVYQKDNELFDDQTNKENMRSTHNSNYEKNDNQIEQCTKSKEKKSQLRQSINSIKKMRESQKQQQQNKEKIFNKSIKDEDEKEISSPITKEKIFAENSLRDAQISQKIRDKYSKNTKNKNRNQISIQRSNQFIGAPNQEYDDFDNDYDEDLETPTRSQQQELNLKLIQNEFDNSGKNQSKNSKNQKKFYIKKSNRSQSPSYKSQLSQNNLANHQRNQSKDTTISQQNNPEKSHNIYLIQKKQKNTLNINNGYNQNINNNIYSNSNQNNYNNNILGNNGNMIHIKKNLSNLSHSNNNIQKNRFNQNINKNLNEGNFENHIAFRNSFYGSKESLVQRYGNQEVFCNNNNQLQGLDNKNNNKQSNKKKNIYTQHIYASNNNTNNINNPNVNNNSNYFNQSQNQFHQIQNNGNNVNLNINNNADYQQQLINKYMNGSQKSFYGNSQNFNYNINNINNSNAIDMYEENIMRRTLKENKFLNQKDRIQDMQLQDQKFLTKHAARFGLNQEDCK